MAIIHVSVINRSTAVSDADLSAALPALQHQISADFAPIWGIDADLSILATGCPVPTGAWRLLILDDAGPGSDLGFRDLGEDGLPVVTIYANSARQDKISWTSVASHELLETLADPFIDATVFVPSSRTSGRIFPVEVCDPVEGDAYLIGAVEVANFVTPQWFMPKPLAGAVFDFMKLARRPFEVRHRGYMDFYDVTASNGWRRMNAVRPIFSRNDGKNDPPPKKAA